MDRWPPAQRCEYRRTDGTRCKRFSSRNARWCRKHMRESRYFQNRRNEVPDMVLAQEVMRDSRELAQEVHAKLHEFAPDALRTIKELADDPDISPSVRLKASEILLRHSGLSPTVNVHGADTTQLIAARLDRLAAAMEPDLVAGVLDATS